LVEQFYRRFSCGKLITMDDNRLQRAQENVIFWILCENSAKSSYWLILEQILTEISFKTEEIRSAM